MQENKTPKQNLAEMLKKHEELVQKGEQVLVDYALEHGLDLTLGDYGSGRSLIHEDKHWSGKARGSWVYSSENC